MKISIYSKVGGAIILFGALLFLIAIYYFTYQSNDPISPLFKNIGEFSIIAWIPVSLIGVFIVAFRMINKNFNNN